MSTRTIFRLFLVAAIALAASTSGLAQDLTAFTGKVTGVLDGNTITVQGPSGVRLVRIAGITAPALNDPYGLQAKEFLTGLVNGQIVTVVGKRSKADQPHAAQVFLQGRDIGYSMLWAGLARNDPGLGGEWSKEDRKLYADAEKFARSGKVSIWSIKKPGAPNEPASRKTAEDRPARTGEPVAAEVTINAAGRIVGKRNSKEYYPNAECAAAIRIPETDRIVFNSRSEAEAAGYRPAASCK